MGRRQGCPQKSKHGVTFVEAATAFLDPRSAEVEDAIHPERFLTIGYSDRSRILCVVAAERSERTRIISARRATREEQELYEEG